jgi:hypothetical protein
MLSPSPRQCYHWGMGLRFRRTFRPFPGVRLNLSKSGVSTSIGTRGAWLTFGKRGTRATMGIPGTGISYTQTVHPNQPHSQHQDGAQAPTQQPGTSAGAWLILLGLLAIAVLVGWLVGVAMR